MVHQFKLYAGFPFARYSSDSSEFLETIEEMLKQSTKKMTQALNFAHETDEDMRLCSRFLSFFLSVFNEI